MSIISILFGCDNHCDSPRDESQSDASKEHTESEAQFALGRFRDVRVAFCMMNANRQFKGDPILHDPHAQLGCLLHPVHVAIDRVLRPAAHHYGSSEADREQSERVESEDG